MKSSKKHTEHWAKTFYKNSLTNGDVDARKVKIILSELGKAKPASLTQILKAYKRLIAYKLAQEEVIIETNDKITNKNLTDSILKKTGAKRVINKTNREITIGARITHGDWIWDDTLDGRLNQLKTNL